MSAPRPGDPSSGADPEAVEPGASASGGPIAAQPGDREFDAERRAFFRSFSRDAVQTAVTVVGFASALQQTLPNATGQLLGLRAPPMSAGQGDPTDGSIAETPGTGFRSPYRYRPGVLELVDQSRLPEELALVECRSGAEAAAAIRMGTIRGGPVLGQAAAYALVLAANKVRATTPFIRSATLHGTLNSLRSARPSSRPIEWSLARLQRRWLAVGEMSEDGDGVANSLWSEAEALETAALIDHAALGQAGAAALPQPPEGPLEVLVHGPVGPLAGGPAGTALAVIQSLAAGGRAVRVWVPEGRPWLHGARVTAWELAQAGVEHAVLADAATGWLLSRSRIDAVLVGAERIACDGAVGATVGTYPLALLAARHGVPFYVCAPLLTFDPALAGGWQMGAEERVATEVTDMQGRRITPAGTPAYNPVLDVTPADLITGFITEDGLVSPPYPETLPAAYEAREARREAIPGAAT